MAPDFGQIGEEMRFGQHRRPWTGFGFDFRKRKVPVTFAASFASSNEFGNCFGCFGDFAAFRLLKPFLDHLQSLITLIIFSTPSTLLQKPRT